MQSHGARLVAEFCLVLIEDVGVCVIFRVARLVMGRHRHVGIDDGFRGIQLRLRSNASDRTIVARHTR